MTQNIYWCYEKDDFYGAYFVAKTRGQAKVMCASEYELHFTDVRTQIVKRGVNETFCGIIESDSPLLEKYGLEYIDTEEW